MDDAELLRRVQAFLGAEIEFWAAGSADARCFRAPGVTASIAAVAPDRSLFNAVTYSLPEALAEAYEPLTEAYRDARVRAFTVWVPDTDATTEAFLAARGHRPDSRPRSMAASLSDLTLPPPEDLEWEECTDLPLLARMNDAAYGFPPPAFAAALTRWPGGEAWRGYLARVGGEPASCLMTCDSVDGDCGITAVASLPAARNRGLAGRLLGRALEAARARGARTTTLQASPMGAPVYARLGYRDLGGMTMWEHRVAPP